MTWGCFGVFGIFSSDGSWDTLPINKDTCQKGAEEDTVGLSKQEWREAPSVCVFRWLSLDSGLWMILVFCIFYYEQTLLLHSQKRN